MKVARIAALRPLLPVEALATAMGKKWAAPDDYGCVPGTHRQGFSAQADVAGKLGKVTFNRNLAPTVMIEGLHIGMSLAAAMAARPTLRPLPHHPELGEWSEYADQTSEGFDLLVRIIGQHIGALQLSQPDAVYPEPEKLLADPHLNTAYDLLRAPQCLQPKSACGVQWPGGWSLGLPPGISQQQWPLSKHYGYPLRHAFTLKIPVQYRVQGEEYVALSLFVDDQFEELSSSAAVEAFFASDLSDEPVRDPALLPFWEHRRARHPMRFDMVDILGTQYAAIWLTEAQFNGDICQPPALADNPLLGPPPGWLQQSYAQYLGYDKVRNPGAPAFDWLPGDGPAAGIDSAFAISAQLREGDPNVGKPPREWEDDCKDSGYVPAFTEQGNALGLSQFDGRNHLGGTMFPIQSYPQFSPFYLEFEEHFGGFNFGSGNAQLDLLKMELDWACG
ncbi:DUF7256 domain-containing protein [Pseudomonas farsensis]|uniref:DUF7256 domain-containing protein n=1 Tax=Pseudomonas farsensis TaxID=2745492 RepID=A0ABU8QZ88_9PSED